jgi:adenosylcobinamide kinase/adenosylcobinamide-phosphate guanylyltransferase
MIRLILGGACSGKSHYAEQLALNSNKKVIYLATARAGDLEMHQRIAQHQHHRPSSWKTVEEPIQLASVLKTYAQPEYCVLIECLTLWLNNILFDQNGEWQPIIAKQQTAALFACLTHLAAEVIFVTNEVGSGIVPINQQSRRFVDEAGRLHQQLAQRCEQVVLVTAGLAQVLK